MPGFEHIQPRVFSGFYPIDAQNYQESRKALDKLSLNDNSFTYEPENSDSLGHGFRCGFLGLLHMEIIRERLSREYNLELLMTVPSVTYKVEIKDGTIIEVKSPKDLPDENQIKAFLEPIAEIKSSKRHPKKEPLKKNTTREEISDEGSNKTKLKTKKLPKKDLNSTKDQNNAQRVIGLGDHVPAFLTINLRN